MIGAVFRQRNPGGHPPHGLGPWGVPGPGGVTVDREDYGETERQKTGIHLRGSTKREEAGYKVIEKYILGKGRICSGSS